MSVVVLCASFPDDGPRGEIVAPYHLFDIAAAAASVAEGVLRNRAELLFAAHPTISPIVLQTAELLGAGPLVRVVQSARFEEATTPEVRRLVDELGATLTTTDAGPTLAASLTAMRRRMFSDGPVGAFFCGGMDGLSEEHEMAFAAGIPCFVFSTPGGQAARIAATLPADIRSSGGRRRGTVLAGREYGSLTLQSLERVGLRRPRPSGPFEKLEDPLSEDGTSDDAY